MISKSLTLVVLILVVTVELGAQAVLVAPSAAFPTIQSAIAAAQGGDVVEVPPGTYSESLDLLGKALTLRSQGGPAVTILSSSQRILLAASGETRATRVEGFGFQGIQAGTSAAVEIVNSGLTIADCRFDGITGPPVSSFQSRSSTIRCNDSVVSILGSTFVNCLGHAGVDFSTAPFPGASGGAIWASGGQIEIADCEFTGNRAGTGGNLIGGTSLFGPSSGGSGGAIYMDGVSAVIRRTTFESNQASMGGQELGSASMLLRLGSAGDGGAIAATGAGVSLELDDCRFVGNESGRRPVAPFDFASLGGAVFARNHPVTVRNCVFIGNGSNQGGALYNVQPYSSQLLKSRVETSVFVGNYVSGKGGALLMANASGGTVAHCVFVGNGAAEGAAIYHEPTPLGFEVANSIFAGSFGPDVGPASGLGAVSANYSNNLLATAPLVGQGNFGGDPGFVDPGNYDFRLRPDSICIDRGLSLATSPIADYDGEPRRFGSAPDVGADEYVGLSPAASGNVSDGQGGLVDVLRVNGQSGGLNRYIVLPLGSAPIWSIDSLPSSIDPDHFILWGRVGMPWFEETFPIYFLGGALCFAPKPFDLFNPGKFIFANSFDPTAFALTPSVPAPFAVQAPAFTAPIMITVQGLILDDVGQFHVSNAVAVDIH